MNYDKEKELALTVCETVLGFKPRRVDIIPLESDHSWGECTYLLFQINNVRNTFYRASKIVNIAKDKFSYTFKLTIERPTSELTIEREIK